MNLSTTSLKSLGLLSMAVAVLWACPFDNTLREYLHVQFWLPFSKAPHHFEKKNVRRSAAPFAGMTSLDGPPALQNLRLAYRKIAHGNWPAPTDPINGSPARNALAAARADKSLTPKEREEVDLIDAKIDLREGVPETPDLLHSAKRKLRAFLRTARTPAYLSEARGWLGRAHYLLGEQTAAGKIYLDELNRNGSYLSRETLLTSLKLTYGYDGGDQLVQHLEEYFDTPEHAAFAIQLVTNPHWDRPYLHKEGKDEHLGPADRAAKTYPRIKSLLDKHAELLKSQSGSSALALLGMRTALRMGDPAGAIKIADTVPATSPSRQEPDFLWMLASAYFVTRDFVASEGPLVALFESSGASQNTKAAAAYGLCGVYRKLGNPVEQIRFALWLRSAEGNRFAAISDIADGSVYWAASGWDLGLLLDSEAPVDALRTVISKYSSARDIRLVKYALAVRLARANQYEESAQIYEAINANRRGPRMRQLASLYANANRADLSPTQRLEAKFKLGEFIAARPNGIYFNDSLWSHLQNYALLGSTESGLSGPERETLIAGERKLRDDQEERWRAYAILRDVARESGKTPLGRRSAHLAINCLRTIGTRFGRSEETRNGEIELWAWLRQ